MIQTTINAFGNALSGVFGFIPRLVGFLVILFVGWLVGIAVCKALTGLLRKVGFDRLSNRMGITNLERRMGMRMDSAQLLGRVAFWSEHLRSHPGALRGYGAGSLRRRPRAGYNDSGQSRQSRVVRQDCALGCDRLFLPDRSPAVADCPGTDHGTLYRDCRRSGAGLRSLVWSGWTRNRAAFARAQRRPDRRLTSV